MLRSRATPEPQRLAISHISMQNSYAMRRIVLLLVCSLPALAHAADRYTLARVLVTGSERYREEDLVRATGLAVNTQVTSDDLQNAANRLGNSGAFSSVQF